MKFRDLANLLTARLSRYVVLWVFVSLTVTEAILLIPSIHRREREVLEQIQQVSSAKIFWITTTYPNSPAEEFLGRVKQLQQDPMLRMILGGALYKPNGELVGSFGEAPELDYSGVMADNPMSFEAGDYPLQSNNRYDAAWLIPNANGNHILVIRHDASHIRTEITAFIIQVTGVVLLVSAVLTLTILGVLGITVITPVLRLRKDLIAAGEAVNQDQATTFYSTSSKRQDELGDVIAAFNQMFQQIWQTMKARKQAEQALAAANQEITELNQQLAAENMRMYAELEVSRKLQKMLLPKEQELQLIPELDIAGFMEPATEVGGDYYDVLNHNGSIKIGIGDVTGHGLESGVLMLMTQTATRTLLTNNETDPVKFLNTLNQTIYGNVHRMNSDKSLTLLLLDYHNGQIRLSGQHETVILVRKDGTLECIDTIDLGFCLGLESDISHWINQSLLELSAGDGLVLYTDGITEAQNSQHECYGLQRLCDSVKRWWHCSAQEIQKAVIQDLYEFIGDQTMRDDVTLLVLKQK